MPVEINLRAVLHEGDGCFSVAHHQERVGVIWQGTVKRIDSPGDNNREVASNEEDDPEEIDITLLTSL